jgi:hypothetical protein
MKEGSPQKDGAFSIIEFSIRPISASSPVNLPILGDLENAFGDGSRLLIDDQFPEAARMLQLAHRVALFLDWLCILFAWPLITDH